MAKFSIHVCALDAECRALDRLYHVGVVPRIHVHTPWGMLIVAYGKDGYVQDGAGRWRPVVWQARRKVDP
jgi:hypothetical protein